MKKFSLLRTLTLCLFLLAVVSGVIWHTGWGTLSSFGIGAIAQICPIGALESAFASKSPTLNVLICLAVFAAVIVLFGRFFCGWLCPVPPLRKLFGTEPKSIEAKETRDNELQACIRTQKNDTETSVKESVIHEAADSSKQSAIRAENLQKQGPFFVLAAALVSSAVFSFPVFCLICPVGLTFALIIGTLHMLKFNDPTITPLVILGVLLFEIFFLRRWCSFICPIGAFISLISRFNKTFVPKIDAQKCLRASGLNCQVCRNACPESIDLRKSVPSSDSSRCLKCGACAQKCPVSAVSFPFFKAKQKNETTRQAPNPVYLKKILPAAVSTQKSVVSKETFTAPEETFTLKNAKLESSRCIQCGACVQACPQHNPIPDVLKALADGDTKAAGQKLLQAGKLPELCSHLCPKDKFCMAACPLGEISEPVNIHALLYFASSRTLDRGYRTHRARTNRKSPSVAVIGAGPAGLAAADMLRSQGFKVTVYERENEIGGLTAYGIPSFKLAKDRIIYRRKLYAKSGIEFQLGSEISSADELLRITDSHDATLIAVGAEEPIALNVPGSDLSFVSQALPYLRADSKPNPESPAKNKHVVVLGIGGTALDCARTAVRQGAASVTCLFRKSLLKANPPRDDYEYAREEGVQFLEETVIQSIEADKTIRVTRPYGSDLTLPAELVICAYGFKGPCDNFIRNAGIVLTKGSVRTGNPKVFAAGDAVNGPGFVTTAIESGQLAAKAISDFLGADCEKVRQSASKRTTENDEDINRGRPAEPVIS